MADNLDRTVHSRAKKTSDIEIHVSTIRTPDGHFTEIREYVVSQDQYGRGVTFPAELTPYISEGVSAADLWVSTHG